MKIKTKVTKILFYLFVALPLFSCGNRRNPNLSEKQLLALMNDTTQKVQETPAVVLPDTSYVPPVGAKFKEIRSVDPASPPVILKVSIPQGAKQPLKLSMFGKSVEYVTLKLPDEKDFFLSQTRIRLTTDMSLSASYSSSTQVSMLGDHFITSDELGIRLFDPSGNFVQNILMSEFDGQRNAQQIEIYHNDRYRRATIREIFDTRCLVTYADYNTNIYFSGIDYKNRKIWAGEFDLSKMPLYTPQSELISTPGLEMAPVRKFPSGSKIDDHTRFSFSGGGGQVGISFNNMGDTLCKFTNYIRLEEGQISGPANSDQSFSYRSEGELYFRQAYCDTIFRVQSANRIVPAYRFDFGEQRATLYEGTNAKTQRKLLPWKWFVLKNSMILIFTEGRDCPACRNAGEVKFYCLLFDRQTGRPTAIDMKSAYPENVLIENDIDGGLPVLLNTLKTQDNVMMATFTKGQIEEILKNNAKNMPAEMVSKLKIQADVLKSNEMLVMKINN